MSTPEEPRPPRQTRWPHLPLWSAAPADTDPDEIAAPGHSHAGSGDGDQEVAAGPTPEITQPEAAKPGSPVGAAGTAEPGPSQSGPAAATPPSAAAGPRPRPIDGRLLTDQEAPAVGREQSGPPRSYLPEAAWPTERQQLTEFVELAHRLRVSSKADLAIGSGEWISTAAARSAAFVISTYLLGGARDADEMTDMLMRPLLLVPDKKTDGKDVDVDLPIAFSHGRILIDTSMSGDGSQPPSFRLVRVNERPELWSGSPESEQGPEPAAADSAEPARSAGTAAVIWGSAAAIAAPYLSIDALMSYARENAFAAAGDGRPASVGPAMRAARDLEVVVLLDQSMVGGLWIDVDRQSGQPAAVLAVELKNAAKPDGIKITALA